MGAAINRERSSQRCNSVRRLLVVVPDTANLTVEAQLANRDVSFVHPGQDVSVKVEIFNFTRYGTPVATRSPPPTTPPMTAFRTARGPRPAPIRRALRPIWRGSRSKGPIDRRRKAQALGARHGRHGRDQDGPADDHELPALTTRSAGRRQPARTLITAYRARANPPISRRARACSAPDGRERRAGPAREGPAAAAPADVGPCRLPWPCIPSVRRGAAPSSGRAAGHGRPDAAGRGRRDARPQSRCNHRGNLKLIRAASGVFIRLTLPNRPSPCAWPLASP
jgi:hypothetical protein